MMTRKVGTILSPEDIILGTDYTFSVNPCDDYQYWHSDKRIDQSLAWMQYTINNIPADIYLKMEISRNGRLHYHGLIKWSHTPLAILDFFQNIIHILLSKATIEINNIKCLSEWSEYCHKGDKFNLPELSTTYSKLKRIKQKALITDVKHKPYFDNLIPLTLQDRDVSVVDRSI